MDRELRSSGFRRDQNSAPFLRSDASSPTPLPHTTDQTDPGWRATSSQEPSVGQSSGLDTRDAARDVSEVSLPQSIYPEAGLDGEQASVLPSIEQTADVSDFVSDRIQSAVPSTAVQDIAQHDDEYEIVYTPHPAHIANRLIVRHGHSKAPLIDAILRAYAANPSLKMPQFPFYETHDGVTTRYRVEGLRTEQLLPTTKIVESWVTYPIMTEQERRQVKAIPAHEKISL